MHKFKVIFLGDQQVGKTRFNPSSPGIDDASSEEEVTRPTKRGPQHTQEVPKEWMSTTLFHRQIVDKWKEFLARRHGKKVFRFNQHAIWTDGYDWKREMRTVVNNIKDI